MGRRFAACLVLPLALSTAVWLPVSAGETAVAEPAAGSPSDPFPFPADFRDGVEFWKKVWTTWTMGQVVFHDDRHHAVVYEIADLPGPVGEAYSEEQRVFVKARREALRLRLREVERKAAAAEPMDDAEKALALQIVNVAGPYALNGASERVRSQRGLRERFLRGLQISGRYHREFTRVFREAGLPDDLAYLPHVESSFQFQARSSAGAVGVWQFTRGAARKFMIVGPAIDERWDPVAAARGAARYLKNSYQDLGDWALAITSYNHGLEGMRGARERFGTDFVRIVDEYDGRYFGFASRNFYLEFLAAREVAKNSTAYFPEGVAFERPLSEDRYVLDRPATPSTISSLFGVPLDRLAALNQAWTRRAMRGAAALPAGVQIWLPEGTIEHVAAGSKPAPRKTAPPATRAAANATPPPRPGAAGGVSSFVIHVVRRGESLVAIASRYGVSLGQLLGVNDLAGHSVIHPGQQIRVPVVR